MRIIILRFPSRSDMRPPTGPEKMEASIMKAVTKDAFMRTPFSNVRE